LASISLHTLAPRRVDRRGGLTDALITMDRHSQRLRTDRDAAYQRIQVAYQDLQVAAQVIQKYSALVTVSHDANSADAIFRRAMEAWETAMREFTFASRDFMAANEQLDLLKPN
jgi:hypothetical protein